MTGTDRDRDDGALQPATGASTPARLPRPLPRDRALKAIRRAPLYARLAWSVGQDPTLPVARKGALLAAAAYVVSPIDAIPGIIPVLGQLDDLLIAVAALRFALMGLSPERRRRHLDAAGLSEAVVEADLATLRDVGEWLLRRGAHLGAMTTRTAMEAGSRWTRRGLDVGSRGAEEARSRVDAWRRRRAGSAS